MDAKTEARNARLDALAEATKAWAKRQKDVLNAQVVFIGALNIWE